MPSITNSRLIVTGTAGLGCEQREEARIFAERIRTEHPQAAHRQPLAVVHWREHLDDETIAKFQRELGAMG